MNNDRSDQNLDQNSDEQGPERIFRTLRNRPTDELDSEALWRRIEGDLEPHPASLLDRVAAALGMGGMQPAALRLAALGAVAAIVMAGAWLVPGLIGPDGARAELGAPGLTAAAPEIPATDAAAAGAWILDVRLVRGYEGAAPADAMISAGAGAGGADALTDLRGRLDDLLPYPELALVGRWQGAVTGSATGADASSVDSSGEQATARLSDTFALRFAAAAEEAGVSLSGVMLDGAGRPLVAEQLALVPGRDYLFGVQAEGEDAETGSLVLAVRLLPATPDPEIPTTDPEAIRQ
jgi:hypothetical protein